MISGRAKAGSAVVVGSVHSAVAAAATGGVLVLLNPAPADRNLATEIVQATGIVALVWAYAGLVLGLLVGIHPVRSAVPDRVRRREVKVAATALPDVRARDRRRRPIIGRSLILDLHRQLNLLVLALVLLHALVFAFLQPGGSLLVALIPGIPGPQALGYTLGVLALYLALLLGPSYYLRDRIGRRAWLVAHQLAALSYAIALWHSLALGSDLRLPGAGRTITWAVQIPLLVLIALRLYAPRRPADQLSPVLRRGRYAGPRHTLLRAAIAIGLISSAVLIMLMALLAATTSEHVTAQAAPLRAPSIEMRA